MFTQLIKSFRHCVRSEGGMTLPLMALSMVMITGMVGMAIDTARAQLVQSKLQFSMDAAGLAAGSTVSTSQLSTEVTKYLNANFNGYLGASLQGVSATVDSTNTVITVSATAQLPTTFMGVLGVNSISMLASSQISRAITGLELVLVLDNTGSMANSAGGGISKIQALQTAANTLVTTLFASNPPTGKLWVGVVPFSQAVNIGTSHPAWMDTTYDNGLSTVTLNTVAGFGNPTSYGNSGFPLATGPGWGTTSWAGCVDARQNGEDVTDDPPNTGVTKTLFDAYYWPSDNLNYGSPFSNKVNYTANVWANPVYKRCYGSNCTPNLPSCTSGGGYTCTLTGYNYVLPLNTLYRGPNLLCPQQVTPMTNVQSTLTSAINAMTAQGDTLINQGLQWGWHMLSPRWQGLWGGTMNANGLPLAYHSTGMAKAVVLLTDGQNTIDDSAHGAYGFLHNGRLGTTTDEWAAITELDNRTLQLCTAMKNQGIYIYTIALGTDTTAASLALLQNCATAENYYFNSPNTSQLQGIFNQIGDSLSNLRVSR